MSGASSHMKKVAVVVLNFNGLDDTLKCLASLRPLAAGGHDVLLVDNGSSVDPGPASLEVLPGLTYVKNGENLGYAGGNNRGIQVALERGADFVLVLNNDTIVSPSIVDELLAVFALDPTLGVVGPVINFMEEPAVVMTDGFAFNPGPGTEFFKRIVVPPEPSASRPSFVPVDIVNGCCMMVRADVLRQVGLFDERLFIVHEESDLCLRVVRAGFGCAVVARTLVWHKGSSSFERSGRQLQRYFDARNLFYLLKRHTGRVSASRGLSVSLWHYGKYCFYRYAVEQEAGKPAAARAVAEGVYDAVRGHEGRYEAGRARGAALVSAVFSVGRAFGALKGTARADAPRV